MSWKRPNIGSRVNREVHARFWERAEVKFLRATRQSLETIVQELRLVVHRLAQNIKFLVEHLRLVGNPACNRMWTAQHIHYGLHRFHSEFSPPKLNFALPVYQMRSLSMATARMLASRVVMCDRFMWLQPLK